VSRYRKDTLIETAWTGLAVEESNLPVQIAALRRVLGEAPGGDRWIETLPRRGYRFVGPVDAQDENVVSGLAAHTDKPSLAVLPFQNFSADPEQEYFADGMVEEAITALSRGRAETAPRDPRRSDLSGAVPLSRCHLCPYGTPRQGAGNRPAASRHRRSRDTGYLQSAERRAAGAIPVRLAASERRGLWRHAGATACRPSARLHLDLRS
jgi:hypothetical protein